MGEADTLGRVTVNIGHVAGGTSMDTSTAQVEARIAAALSGLDGVTWRVLRRFEPSSTPPDAEIVRTVAAVAGEVLGRAPAVNMRAGGSDSRLFRMAGIPTVVYGPTPHNMGGADEYATVEELHAVATVHALSAFDFLSVT